MAILLTKWGKREHKTNLGFRLVMAKSLFSEVGKVAINKAEIELKIWFFLFLKGPGKTPVMQILIMNWGKRAYN